jgi:hypothetical protein
MPEDAKKAEGVQEGPGGTKTRLPLKATKKLKISVETKDGDSTSSRTSESFVAEKGWQVLHPRSGRREIEIFLLARIFHAPHEISARRAGTSC